MKMIQTYSNRYFQVKPGQLAQECLLSLLAMFPKIKVRSDDEQLQKK